MHENDNLWNDDKEGSKYAQTVLVMFYLLKRKKILKQGDT